MIRASRRKLLPRPATQVVSKWWLMVGCILLCAVAWIWNVLTFLAVGAIFVLWLIDVKLRQRKLQRIANGRVGESICSFARSFNFRKTDTLIVRSVHEEIQDYLNSETASFPLRSSDRFEHDLSIDGDDLDDLATVIAARAGRSLQEAEKNPYHAKVETVADLVSFLSQQPRLKFSE